MMGLHDWCGYMPEYAEHGAPPEEPPPSRHLSVLGTGGGFVVEEWDDGNGMWIRTGVSWPE